MPETEQTSLPLPGLADVDDAAVLKAGELAAAVRRSVRALDAMGLVQEHDAARLQLALELADIITIKKRTGRMSTVGNDARVLVDLLDKLLPEQTEVDDELREAVAAWTAAGASTTDAPAP
jgi:hypothetical protein